MNTLLKPSNENILLRRTSVRWRQDMEGTTSSEQYATRTFAVSVLQVRNMTNLLSVDNV